jgi:hypothetical protein
MRSKKRPLKIRLLTIWSFIVLLLCKTAFAAPPDDPLKEPSAIEKYTVQIGTFKEIPPE